MQTPTERYIEARATYEAIQAKADEAFARYFSKREAGERTSGAAWQRIENQANYASAAVASAEIACWAEDDTFDPDEVWEGRGK